MTDSVKQVEGQGQGGDLHADRDEVLRHIKEELVEARIGEANPANFQTQKVRKQNYGDQQSAGDSVGDRNCGIELGLEDGQMRGQRAESGDSSFRGNLRSRSRWHRRCRVLHKCLTYSNTPVNKPKS